MKELEGSRLRVIFMKLKENEFWNNITKEIEMAGGKEIRRYHISALGRLLEDLIFSSKSMRDCLKKFGNDSGSENLVNFIVLQIPMIGGTIYTAVEFYGLGKIMKSNHMTQSEKMDEIFRKMTKVGMKVGTAVGGGVVGQIVIPVPIVGALVGGIVGGAVGSLFSSAYEKLTERDPIPFTMFAKYLLYNRQEDGAWRFENFNQGIKPVIVRWFDLTKPTKVDEILWLTILCFIILSLYHTILRQKQTQMEKDAEENIRQESQTSLDLDYTLNEINDYLEQSIIFLAQRLNLLDYEKHILKITDAMSELCKESFLKYDL